MSIKAGANAIMHVRCYHFDFLACGLNVMSILEQSGEL